MKRKKILFVFLLLFFCLKAKTQILSPHLLCATDDSLVWEAPNNNCGSFIAYKIFASPNLKLIIFTLARNSTMKPI